MVTWACMSEQATCLSYLRMSWHVGHGDSTAPDGVAAVDASDAVANTAAFLLVQMNAVCNFC